MHPFQRATCLPGRPLLLDEVFVLIPWLRAHIISTTLPAPSSLAQLFNSLITAFLSALSLTRPPLPLAAAYPPSLLLSPLLWLCLGHFSLMWSCCGSAHSKNPFLSALSILFYIGFCLFPLCFLCGFHLHWFAVSPLSGFVFFFNKPSTLPMTVHCRQTTTALTFNAWCSRCLSEPHQLWTSPLNTNVKYMQLKQISMWLPLK